MKEKTEQLTSLINQRDTQQAILTQVNQEIGENENAEATAKATLQDEQASSPARSELQPTAALDGLSRTAIPKNATKLTFDHATSKIYARERYLSRIQQQESDTTAMYQRAANR